MRGFVRGGERGGREGEGEEDAGARDDVALIQGSGLSFQGILGVRGKCGLEGTMGNFDHGTTYT